MYGHLTQVLHLCDVNNSYISGMKETLTIVERNTQYNVSDSIKTLMEAERISIKVLSEHANVNILRLTAFLELMDVLNLEEFNSILKALKIIPRYGSARPKRYPVMISWPKENSLNHFKGLR